MKMQIVVGAACALLAFAGGVAVGHWAWPDGDGDDGDAEVAEDMAGEAEEASEGEDGVVAQEGGEEPGEKFVEAVPAESVKDDGDSADEAMVEEVRDEEEGLTDEELAEKFKREHPEEWERIQSRRKAMLEALRKAQADRTDFLTAVSDEFLSAEQRKVHAAYRTALAVRDEARERIRRATASGGEADVEDYRLMNQANRTVQENAQAEHAALREALGRSLGIPDADLPTFVETLKSIDDAVERRQGPFFR